MPALTSMDRRRFLGAALAAGAASRLGAAARPQSFPLVEVGVADLQAAMASGRLTAEALARGCLARIRGLDRTGPRLGAVVEVNPEALALARALDRERAARGPRGPLHGIPVLLKDNIDTADRMATTAGSLALLDAPAPVRDAGLVARLREAGAVLLGKTNLGEWANFRSTHSTNGWTGRGGLTRNPYALDRNCSGSSSGSAAAVAASLCPLAVGTETDGSIVSPASLCGLVGLKPTLGLVSRAGVVPIAHSQDTAGPMARSVRDAALLLAAMAGADPRDAATAGARVPDLRDLGTGTGALRGARLGVVRAWTGINVHVDRVFEGALALLAVEGAVLVDPVEIGPTRAYEDAETEVLLYEFKADLEAYLAGRGGAVRDLKGLAAFNEAHRDREMPWFGQELVLQAAAKGPLSEEAYRTARARCLELAWTKGLEAALAKGRLDALVAPTSVPAWPTDLVNGDPPGFCASTPAAVAGTPHLTVPMGQVHGLPVGLSLMGGPWTEGRLLALGAAFEAAARARRPPRYLRTLPLDPSPGPKAP